MTAGMILWNGERSIIETIVSIYECVDKIHVGYTNNAVNSNLWELVNAMCMMHKIEWNDDYSYARNQLMDKSGSCKWYYWIDSDEVLLTRDRHLGEIADKGGKDCYEVTYVVPCRALNNNDGMVSIDKGTRLFRGDKGYMFTNTIHEVIDIDVRAKGGEIGKLDIKVYHHGYAYSKEIMHKKNERYVERLLVEVNRNPGNAQMWKYLGQSLLAIGRLRESVDAYNYYLVQSKDEGQIEKVKTIINDIKGGRYGKI